MFCHWRLEMEIEFAKINNLMYFIHIHNFKYKYFKYFIFLT